MIFNPKDSGPIGVRCSCYIFGDGPSIRYLDYADFLDRPVISCGNQLFHKQHKLLNSVAYIIIEPWLFYPRWLLKAAGKTDLAAHYELTKRYVSHFDNEVAPDFYINYNNMLPTLRKYHYLSKNSFRSDSRFCEVYTAGINPIGGSFFGSISLAIKLGFTDICLVGFDAFTLRASPFRWYSKESEDPLLIRRDHTLDASAALQFFDGMAQIQILSVSEAREDPRFLSYCDFRSGNISLRSFEEIIDAEDLGLLRTTYS